VGNREGYVRYLGHEAAHLWWWGAETTSWEDWLNESFAEYSALLAVRERFGPAAFEERLAVKREASQDSAPIWGLERSDISTADQRQMIETVLYAKGPIVLHELATKIGQPRFLVMCQHLVAQEANSTAALLALLGKLEGPEIKQWLVGRLKTGPLN
jgi:aminopeptidase N